MDKWLDTIVSACMADEAMIGNVLRYNSRPSGRQRNTTDTSKVITSAYHPSYRIFALAPARISSMLCVSQLTSPQCHPSFLARSRLIALCSSHHHKKFSPFWDSTMPSTNSAASLSAGIDQCFMSFISIANNCSVSNVSLLYLVLYQHHQHTDHKHFKRINNTVFV